MTKRDLFILEKAFIREINGRRFQSKSKQVQKLAKMGYLHHVKTEERTGLGMFHMELYELTHMGRLEYCLTCTDEDIS